MLLICFSIQELSNKLKKYNPKKTATVKTMKEKYQNTTQLFTVSEITAARYGIEINNLSCQMLGKAVLHSPQGHLTT